MAAAFAAGQTFVLEEYSYPVASWATTRTDDGRYELGAQHAVDAEIRARQLAFLNRIPGEVSDSDGDTANEFILADADVPQSSGKQDAGKHCVSSAFSLEGKWKVVQLCLDSDDDTVEVSPPRESCFTRMTTTGAKRSAPAVVPGSSSSTRRGPEGMQQASRRAKQVERSEGVSPARSLHRGQSAKVHNVEAMGGGENLSSMADDCYAAGARSRRSLASKNAKSHIPSQHRLGSRSWSHDVIDLDEDEPPGPRAGMGDSNELDVRGESSGRPRLQKLGDANHQPSLRSDSSRGLAGTSAPGCGKGRAISANLLAGSCHGRAGDGAAAAPDTFGAAVSPAAGSGAGAGHFFGADSLEEGDTGDSFFCVLCQNSVPQALTLEMPACSCRFCSFCLEPAIHMQLEAMALQVESGMLQGKATDQGLAAGGAMGGIGLSPLQLSGRPGGSKEGHVQCPGCAAHAPPSVVKALAPVAYRALEGALKSAELISSQPLLACPSCGLRTLREASELPLGAVPCGVPEIDRTAPSLNDTDDAGRPLSLAALQHRETHRFRCPQCTTVYCGSCARVPYHTGRTCVEQAVWESRPSCRFCAERVEVPSALDASPGPSGRRGQVTVRELRRQVAALGADEWWCVEKKDLQAVLEWASQICQAPECQEKLRTACTRTHVSCGHPCGGVKKEAPCLPCLHEDCAGKGTAGKEISEPIANEILNGALQAAARRYSGKASPPKGNQAPSAIKLPCADDFCPICWVDPLGAAPSLLLACGHVVHAACAREKVHQGYPGPEISFAYLRCPVCPELMDHVYLFRDMEKHLELKCKVDQLLQRRVEAEVGAQRPRAAKSPGRRSFGRAGPAGAGAEAGAGGGAGVDVAATRAELVRRCLFFECSRCKQPYYGGDRRCGEAAGGAGAGPEAGGAEGAGAGGDAAGAAGQARGRAQVRDAAAAQQREKQKQELICGDCVAAEMARQAREAGARAGAAAAGGVCQKGHGSGYVQYKCRYCCYPASFFCFGTTHFCFVCHNARPDCVSGLKFSSCRGGSECPLGVPEHPPAPSEFCLGCALCRVEADKPA